MTLTKLWRPPGKNCGLCGNGNCSEFMDAIKQNVKQYGDCPFYTTVPKSHEPFHEAVYDGTDVLGHAYDFVLEALPGEISARKIILPFRPDLVDKLEIKKNDYCIGRPMGAGCPIPHVVKVIEVDYISGVLTTWVVGPKISREKPVKELQAYHMLGFEGIAGQIRKEPTVGARVTFLPGCCMMNLNHTGLVNMMLVKNSGYQVRIEDIRILAGAG